MSVRTIELIGSIGLVKKSVEGSKTLPRLNDLEDLENFADIISGKDYLALYQIFKEVQIWEMTAWDEKELIAPILQFGYNETQSPFLIFPYFEPLVTEQEASQLTTSQAKEKIYSFLQEKGFSHQDSYDWIRRVRLFCDDWGLNEEDILFNLNNLGWNDIFGLRILDYGMTDQIVKDFLERY